MGLSRFYGGPNHGKVCCDHCPSGVGRKRSCPYGWCPAVYLCAACWANSEVRAKSKAWHEENDCEVKVAMSKAKAEERKALLAAGHPLRKAAVGIGGGFVKVWFERSGKPDLIAFVTNELYDAFPLLESVALQEFEEKAKDLGLPAPSFVEPKPASEAVAA